MWFEQMHSSWRRRLGHHRAQLDALELQLAGVPNLAPQSSRVMAAFETDPETIKVVVLGQDPYPTPGSAIGYSFAVANGTKIPASLRNIATELKSDLGHELVNTDLSHWRAQGVWLLNRHLTTIQGQPAAHANLGWDSITTSAIRSLVTSKNPLVLVLWGSQAQKIERELATELDSHSDTVTLIRSAHPSPLSAYRGFFGSRPFSKINTALIALKQEPIEWNRNAP